MPREYSLVGASAEVFCNTKTAATVTTHTQENVHIFIVVVFTYSFHPGPHKIWLYLTWH